MGVLEFILPVIIGALSMVSILVAIVSAKWRVILSCFGGASFFIYIVMLHNVFTGMR